MPLAIELKALVLIGAMAGSAYVMHKMDNGQYQALQAQVAQANATAMSKALAAQQAADEVNRRAADQEAAKQRDIAGQAQAALKEVKAHVTVKSAGPCVTWGLVRVLDAAAQGVSTSYLPAPGGKSDAACAGTDALALARSVVGNYFIALQNAQQLNALIANIKAGRTAYLKVR